MSRTKKESGKKQIDQDDEDKLHLDYLKYTKEIIL